VGGRDGAARSSDNQLDIKLASPGSGRPGVNPEQLFAAGWSACFEGALGIAAKQSGVELPADTAVDAEVQLHYGQDEGYFLTARLSVSIPGVPEDVAAELIELAHETCPYSKMTREGIETEVVLGSNTRETSFT
jgi:Ohr subfamily peroxiredoxin